MILILYTIYLENWKLSLSLSVFQVLLQLFLLHHSERFVGLSHVLHMNQFQILWFCPKYFQMCTPVRTPISAAASSCLMTPQQMVSYHSSLLSKLIYLSIYLNLLSYLIFNCYRLHPLHQVQAGHLSSRL